MSDYCTNCHINRIALTSGLCTECAKPQAPASGRTVLKWTPLTQEECGLLDAILKEYPPLAAVRYTVPYTGGQYKLDESFTDATASIALDGDTVAGCDVCHVNAAMAGSNRCKLCNSSDTDAAQHDAMLRMRTVGG